MEAKGERLKSVLARQRVGTIVRGSSEVYSGETLHS